MALSDMDEVFARLTMLEFVAEVRFANDLANVSAETADAFLADLVEKSKRTYGVMTADPNQAQRLVTMAERCTEMTRRFAAKVARRAAEIRARITQGP